MTGPRGKTEYGAIWDKYCLQASFGASVGFFYFLKWILWKTSDSACSQGYQIEGSTKGPRKGVMTMEHKLKVSVSKKPQTGGIVTCRTVSIRERFMRCLFGDKRRVTVLIPGDSVGEIAICETMKGEDADDQNRTDP